MPDIEKNPWIHYLVICITILFICGLAFFNTFRNKKCFKGNHKQFLILVCITAVTSIFDFFMWFLDGKSYKGAELILTIDTALYYIGLAVPLFCWITYIFKGYIEPKKYAYYVQIVSLPLIVEIIACIISIKTGLFFEINVDSLGAVTYSRGPLSWLYVMVVVFYGIMDMVAVFFLRDRIGRREFMAYIYTPLISMGCGFVQAIWFGLDTYILANAIMCLECVSIVLKEASLKDSLTGVYNRRKLSEHLDYLYKKRNSKTKYVFGTLINLGDLNTINENFGHVTGDEALVEAAKVITSSFPMEALITRYAGTEFVCVFLSSEDNIDKVYVEKLKKESAKWNDTHLEKKYRINLTINSLRFDFEDDFMPESFIGKIDEEIYKEKSIVDEIVSTILNELEG